MSEKIKQGFLEIKDELHLLNINGFPLYPRFLFLNSFQGLTVGVSDKYNY